MQQRRQQSFEIPRFFLFGEAPQTVGDRYLHLEPLSDRSRPNNWDIRSHAHAELSHIFHIVAGAGTMRAEDSRFAFEAPCALLVPAGVVHGFHFQPETEGHVLTLSGHYLEELTLRERCFAPLFQAPAVLGLSLGALQTSLEALSRELVWIAAGHGAAIEAHLLCILVSCVRALEEARKPSDAGSGVQALLVARFRERIEQHFRQDLPLSRYSAMLSASERQLRTACLKVAGLPPSQLIQRRLQLEAKRALLYSNMTVSEVAYYLGFNDPAYFSRFFTRATGKSPRLFRNRVA